MADGPAGWGFRVVSLCHFVMDDSFVGSKKVFPSLSKCICVCVCVHAYVTVCVCACVLNQYILVSLNQGKMHKHLNVQNVELLQKLHLSTFSYSM